MRPSGFLLRTAVAGTATAGLIAGSTLFTSGAGAALPAARTYEYTGSAQSYEVPDGVCEVQIVAAGAQGGTWSLEQAEGPEIQARGAAAGKGHFATRSMNKAALDDGAPVPGGLGGTATAVVTVTPGEQLQVNVGGAGGDSSVANGHGVGGWNGGGAGGGTADPSQTMAWGGGGGGGASDVRRGGFTLTERVAVGGGGGGAGVDAIVGNAPFGVPGVGGNPATPGGDEPSVQDYTGATGGGAGSATAGGTAGTGGVIDEIAAPDGQPGTLGAGGAGGTESEVPLGGGGGGGGLYGGGGGGVGIEFIDGAGGGGSSLGDSTEPGTQAGNGIVTVTPTRACDEPTTVVPTTVAPTSVEPASTVTSTSAPTTTVAPVAAPHATAVSAKPTYTG